MKPPVSVDSAGSPGQPKQRPAKTNVTSTPEERLARWDRFFDNEKDPNDVREVVAELIDGRKYDEVTSCIEQAILHGQIQPWMHQVLALSMQAAGRPQAQIERVLLSSQDLISNDAGSMMHLAAYLVRFDRFDRAIELYRQAAALNPSRPEPYILALEIAARTKNYPAISWSAPEVLSYSWTKGREQMNRLAETSAAEAEAAFIKDGDFARAIELRQAMQKARELDLVIRLEWSGQGDLDMQVEEPSGTICSITHSMTSAGGIFVHDGYGPNQNECYEEYLCPQGLAGEYRVVINHVSGDIIGKRARVTIIRNKGTKNEQSVTETLRLGAKESSLRFSLGTGRRQAANAEQSATEPKRKPQPGGPETLFAQLGAGGGAGQFAQRSAIGYTPIVSVINEGVRMSAMATVSGDRRYVRVSAAPFFSTITDVLTFSYVK